MREIIAVTSLLALLLAGPARGHDGLQPGMRAPAITLETLDGGRVALGEVKGARAALVVFWATWSAASPEVLERAQKLAAAHAGSGLTVLGVNVEAPTIGAEQLPAVRAMVGRLGLTFPVALDRGLEAFHAYGVVAVPSSILVTPDGKVLATLAAYPIAGREAFFDLVEATVTGRPAAAPPPAREGPEPNPRAVRYFNLGRTMLARGMTEQAVANLRTAMEADRTFALPRIVLGQVLRERAAAREVVRGEGQPVETVHRLESERRALLDDAERLLTEALALDASNPAALTEMALVARHRGDAVRARDLVDRALAVDAAYPPARSQRGALRLAAGDVAAGAGDLAAAIALNPLDWRLHITAAEAFERRGMTREALAAYRRGVELLWQLRAEPGAAGR